MPSQFFGLNIAYTGLLASNAALNTTANNISNVQTEGYSRQQVDQQAANALRIFQTYGCAGAGVETLAIERIRDEFYDGKFWDNRSKVGEYDMKQYYMKQVETYFDDDGKNAGFKTVFDQFMINGIEEIMKNPSSAATKAQFVGYAGALTEYFNGLAGNLEEVQKDINQEIKLKIDEMNSIASEIATLNKQINTIELTGAKANELRDRRTLLVDQLSEIVDVDVREIPVTDTNNPERETGANRYLVKIAGGQVLVDTNEFNGLECVARRNYEKVNQTDVDGLYDVVWENGQTFNLYNAAMGGALRGLVEMRDGNNNEYFTGKVTATGTKSVEDKNGNPVDHDTVTIAVTKEHLQDLNKSNLSDQGGVINIGNQNFYYDSWEFDPKTNEYTFILSDSTKNEKHITNDRVDKVASIGSGVNYQGIPYYMNQMNEWVRTFAEKFNDILTSGFSYVNEPGTLLFTGGMTTSDEQYQFEKRYDQGDVVATGDDSYYRLTAKNFTILDAVNNEPGILATKKSTGDGVEQTDLLKELRNMAYDKTKMTFRGASASEFLQCMLSDVALNASRANGFQECYTNISGAIDNQRLSISGVDEDEEAVNLVKYQNAYNLASKMIQTLTEIYDRLILQTGV